MKLKYVILIIGLGLLTSIYFYANEISPNTTLKSKLATYNIVKCTTPNFLLGVIDSTKQIAPLFDNLGDYEYRITTNNKKAQIFFNQGLKLGYAFNHSESHRSFLEASRLDPNCAMAYWGQAYVLGPNINDQLPDSERRIKSFEAVQKAKKLGSSATLKEQALINALTFRYSKDSVNIATLNMAYMLEMEKVMKAFPNDPDILTLFAASVMNTVPWNYWDKEGNPSPHIIEAKSALEKALEININHPGANHYYIHLVELPKPDLGVPSADRLGSLMPGAGHMVHMPGHIYMRVGRYEDAVKVNHEAILADEDYISQCYAQGLYPLGYYPHNIHFLWYAASMLGDSKTAIDAARKTAEKVPIGDMENEIFYQKFASTPLLAYLRFGKWNDILTTPNPGKKYTYLNLIFNYTRGIAFLRKNNLKEAEEELNMMVKRDTALEQENIAKIAHEVLAGEIEAFKGNSEKAIAHLNKAVSYEDALPYDEPSLWYIPTRQTLGDILLKANKFEAAEKIYLEDLDYYRQNGWSLIGLYQSLIGQGKTDEANEIKKQFQKSWRKSDIKISNSVL